MKKLALMSKAQVDAFPFAKNFRPPQPLNGRPVSAGGYPGYTTTSSWGYGVFNGPASWGSFASTCNGQAQSPINILSKAVEVNKYNVLTEQFTSIDRLTVSNNGHTIVATPDAGGKSSYSIFDDQPYTLLQFHWHRGSEHQIDARQFPLEVHLVHRHPGGRLLVLGIMYEIGNANEALNSLGFAFKGDLPATNGAARKFQFFDPYTLMPASNTYYNYDGSLTTPPCSEIVNWIVFDTYVTLSQEQLDNFPFANNFRPPQPLYGRMVRYLSRFADGDTELFVWGYDDSTDGPSKWGRFYPMCKGKEQSPVDILACSVVERPSNRLVIEWHKAAQMTIRNDGHTIRIDCPAGGCLDVKGNRSSSVVFEGKRFQMLQFHFHSQSETRIDGRQFPLEVHFVHQNVEDKSLLVVGILFSFGVENAWLTSLGWPKLPAANTVQSFRIAVNPSIALPPIRNYYTYAGSLTTPPCTEGVRWIVLTEFSSLSEGQLALYPFPFQSFRPPQSLFSRKVYLLSAPEAIAVKKAERGENDVDPFATGTFVWGYGPRNGPDAWAKNGYPECNGPTQSPIDIMTTKSVDVSSDLSWTKLNMQWNDVSGLSILNNGHTVVVNGAMGTTTLYNVTYNIVQFHFHHMSETLVDGLPYPLEVHIVHQQAGQNKLLVIGVLFAISETENQWLRSLSWSSLPLRDRTVALNTVNPSGALPKSHSYYSYDGSLTTPPCTGGVQWIVMTNTVPIHRLQVDQFTTIFPGNSRPVMPLNGRVVYRNGFAPKICAPGCSTESCVADPMSFPAAKNGNTCYNPAAVGLNIDQVCCAVNSCPCTSVTGKGIATKDPLTGQCPGGCDGVCDAGAIAAAAKGFINEAMALCQAPIDPAATKCCSVSSGCVCTAVGTPQKGTDFATKPAAALAPWSWGDE